MNNISFFETIEDNKLIHLLGDFVLITKDMTIDDSIKYAVALVEQYRQSDRYTYGKLLKGQLILNICEWVYETSDRRKLWLDDKAAVIPFDGRITS